MANCDDNTCPPKPCDLENAIKDYKKSRSGVNDSSVKPFLKIIDQLQKEIQCIDNTGSSGSSGSSGENGTSGTSGFDGTSGSSGISGTNGTSGTSGETGSSGTSGLTGTSGSSGTSGNSGSSGTSGTSGSNGTSGSSGTSGTSGINGVDGANTGRWVLSNCISPDPIYPDVEEFKTFNSIGSTTRVVSDIVQIKINKYSKNNVNYEGWFSELKSLVNSTATVYLQLYQIDDSSITGLWIVDSFDDSNLASFDYYILNVSVVIGSNTIDCNALCALSWTATGLSGEVLKPTANLTSPTVVQFNQVNIKNFLTGSYIINQSGATISGSILSWRRNNSGSWNYLTASLNTPLYYTHSLTDTNFNTSSFNYRYYVIDSLGTEASASLNIIPLAYVSASSNLNVIATAINFPEINRKRERGNVSSTLSGLISKNSNFVSMSSYSVEFRVNGGNWFGVPGLTNIAMGGNTVSIPSTIHVPTGSANITDVSYRVQVVDTYTSSYASPKTVDFLYMMYYGPSVIKPITSSMIRSLENRRFVDDSNPFILYTGGAYSIFTVAMPSTFNLAEVLDLDAGYTNLTTNYSQSNFNVMDSGSNATPYHIYTLSNSIAYTDYNHRHRISTTGLLWYTPTITTLDYTE